MVQEAALQVGERVLHHGDTVAHREQAVDLIGIEEEN
jgi:hypothetical protein